MVFETLIDPHLRHVGYCHFAHKLKYHIKRRKNRREQFVAHLEGVSQFTTQPRSPKNIELYADTISITSLHPFRSLWRVQARGISLVNIELDNKYI